MNFLKLRVTRARPASYAGVMFSGIDSVIGRATAVATIVATLFAGGVAAATTDADPPVATGEVGGATVAVAAPPVPPTTAEVAVGLPPVPPTTTAVASAPPGPPTTQATTAATPTTAPPTTVPFDPELAARRVTSLVVDAATQAALALRR